MDYPNYLLCFAYVVYMFMHEWCVSVCVSQITKQASCVISLYPEDIVVL